MLTDLEKHKLLSGIKYFICLQTHPRFNGGSKFTANHAVNVMTKALYFVDWVLLNAEKFKLGEFGFSLISSNDFKKYFANHIAAPVSESLYDVNLRLSRWLREKSAHLTEDEIDLAIERWPWINELPDPDDRVLSLSDEELVRARAGICLRDECDKRYGVWTFRKTAFINDEFVNTLHGRFINCDTPPELSSQKIWRQEYPRVPVSGNDGGSDNYKRITRHLSALKKLAAVNHFYVKLNLDADILMDLSTESLINHSDGIAGTDGRFLTLPAEVPFKAMRIAIESLFSKVDIIFSAMGKMFSHQLSSATSELSATAQLNNVFAQIHSPEIYSTGVACWSISELAGERVDSIYFSRLRVSPGLFEAYETAQGMLLILIGGLTARRQAEIIELSSDNCLQPNKNPFLAENAKTLYNLRFPGGKTGSGETRQTLSIPITSLIAKAIWRLKELNNKFVELKMLRPHGPLFFCISKKNLVAYELTAKEYNHYLDMACDVAQTSVINFGDGVERRYYIRQHQLRRFLAMTFFWSAGFDGLETLRYYLGHVDVKHLYRYITECLSGEVLRTVKVDKILDSIVNGRSDLDNIEVVKHYLSEKFNCADIVAVSGGHLAEEYGYLLANNLAFSNVPIETEAERYRIRAELTKLMQSKVLTLEPEFLSYDSDKSKAHSGFRLVVKMRFQ
jgi:hypothetical protein